MHAKETLLRYFNTLRHLKFKQVTYRLFYACYTPKIANQSSQQNQQKVRSWQQSWHAPLKIPTSLADSGELSFLNETVNSLEAFSWNDPKRSKLWLYHLHYFDYLNEENEDIHLDLSLHLIQKWIKENPPLHGNGWEPYPLSLRIVNWIKWFARNPSLVQRHWLDSLSLQAEILSKQIEYHLLANHIFANAKALVFAGCYFKGKIADRWLKKGLRILRQQKKEQFLADGGHFELSPMYHATLLWDLCDLVNLAYRTGIPELLGEINSWQRLIESALPWLNAMSHPDGKLAFFNDTTFDMAPSFAACKNYAQTLGLGKSASSAKSITSFRESGYCVIDFGEDNKAILDVGRIGPDYQPGHAHADTLSFELSLFGQRIFVNSGISEYGTSKLRLYQRGTKAHNTVCIDDKNSSDVWSGFRVGRRAKPLHFEMTNTDELITVGCSHDGYSKFNAINIHRRVWQISTKKLVVQDSISGYFKNANARFYLHPEVIVLSVSDKALVLALPSGEKINLWLEGEGSLSIGSSNWYPSFGKMQNNSCVIASFSGKDLRTCLEW